MTNGIYLTSGFCICNTVVIMVHTKQDELPDLLLRCRSDRRLTLQDVADAIGVSKQAVSSFEARKSRLRRTTKLRLVEFLRKHGYFAKVTEAA